MSYWQARAELEYYAVVRRWLDELGPLGSLADVGSADTPVATWGDADQRWTVDPRERPALSGVRQIVGRWPDCAALLPRCDVVTCLQTLEHVADPVTFCAALVAAARVAVIVSVPWLWPAGACKSHIQDPVDGAKLAGWMGRAPDLLEIVGALPRAVGLYRV